MGAKKLNNYLESDISGLNITKKICDINEGQ